MSNEQKVNDLVEFAHHNMHLVFGLGVAIRVSVAMSAVMVASKAIGMAGFTWLECALPLALSLVAAVGTAFFVAWRSIKA
jgi:hypothetical protein